MHVKAEGLLLDLMVAAHESVDMETSDEAAERVAAAWVRENIPLPEDADAEDEQDRDVLAETLGGLVARIWFRRLSATSGDYRPRRTA